MGKNNSKEAGTKAAPPKAAAQPKASPAKAAAKPAKAEPKKAEAKPKAEPKKEEPKKEEPKKEEPKKEEPKAEAKEEQKEEKKEEEMEDEELATLFTKLQESKDATSLLKKYLTKEVFDSLKGKKTALGCDLKSCIRSGCENLDSGIGVYASDAEAYVLFADLLNKVICDYHKLDSLDGFKHPSQNFAFDDSFTGNVDESGEFVLSTRIRVARNVAGYPLRGGMDEKQTVELEQKVKAILEGLDDEDLKGKYYPLEGMDEETRAQLVADHFLFKKGDRFLESAGINQFWPKGRGIFFNDNKTFLVWINEEDQLRIISMEQGGNVKSVFNRLEKAVSILCKKLDFAFNEQLGYLTACPTNIGCGERASVHIKLPLLSAQYSEIEAIANQFNLQIRGVHGEHSEAKGGVYDVSNKRRLGITEWDGVKDLVEGALALIEAEKALQSKASEAQQAAEAEKAAEEEKEREAEAERVKAEEEAAAAQKAAEAEQKRKEEEAEAERVKAEEEAAAAEKLKAEEAEAEAARVKAEAEEAERKRIAEEEAEAARVKAEAEEAEAEAARVKAEEEEAARLKAEEEEKEKEAERVKAEEEAEAARIKAEEEEAAKLEAEAEAQKEEAAKEAEAEAEVEAEEEAVEEAAPDAEEAAEAEQADEPAQNEEQEADAEAQ